MSEPGAGSSPGGSPSGVAAATQDLDPALAGWAKAVDQALAPSELKWLRLRLAGDRIAAVCYLDSVVDLLQLREDVVRPLSWAPADAVERALALGERAADPRETVDKVARGWAAAFVQGHDAPYLFDLYQPAGRAVEQPTTEQILLGPKNTFVEDLKVNLSLLRARIRSPDLQVERFRVGRRSGTDVALLSIRGVTASQFLERLRDGLRTLDLDWLEDTAVLSELLVGRTWSPVPLGHLTERPVRALRALMAGRAAILVDGSPFCLLLPATAVELQKDTERYIQGPLNRTFVRFMRAVGAVLALATPGVYAALLSVNPQILPTPLAITVALTREGVPYPVLGETLMMLLVLDVVYEATITLPGPLGQTLTIVGSLIIGQAAVAARLASGLIVIVLALTVLGTLVTVNFPLSFALRIWKYPVTVLAGLFGSFGLILGVALFVAHLASLKSLGVPYLKPFAPLEPYDAVHYGLAGPSAPGTRYRPRTWRPEDRRRTGPGGREEPR